MGNSFYTIIAPTASITYNLTASTGGAAIKKNDSYIISFAGSSGSITRSGSFSAVKGDVIQWFSQYGTSINITENFGYMNLNSIDLDSRYKFNHIYWFNVDHII